MLLLWPIVDEGGRPDVDPGESEVSVLAELSVLPEVDAVLEPLPGPPGGRVEVNEGDKGPSLEPMAGLKPLVISPVLSVLDKDGEFGLNIQESDDEEGRCSTLVVLGALPVVELPSMVRLSLGGFATMVGETI